MRFPWIYSCYVLKYLLIAKFSPQISGQNSWNQVFTTLFHDNWQTSPFLRNAYYPYKKFDELQYKIPVLSLETNIWEQELFPSNKYIIINEVESFIRNFTNDPNNMANQHLIPRVLIYSIANGRDGNKFEIVNRTIQLFRPAVLIHIQDEYYGMTGRHETAEFERSHLFYDEVPLVLHEYGKHMYRSANHPRMNVIQIPMGYMMRDFNYSITSEEMILEAMRRNSSSRIYQWSFIGTIYGHTRWKDRVWVINEFKKWGPYMVTNANSSTMREVYMNSKFVLMTRGHENLACLRFFEAMLSGAIPVVVGEDYRIDGEFEYEGDPPPAIYTTDINRVFDTLAICKNMTDDDIDLFRVKMTNWWLNYVKFIKNRIEQAISVFTYQFLSSQKK